MNRGKLSAGQVFWLTFSTMFPTVVLLLPGDLIRAAGQYAWCTPLVASIPAMAFAWMIGNAGARGGGLVASARRHLGPLLGRAFLVVVWGAMGVYTVLAVREAMDIASQVFVIRPVPPMVLELLGLIPAAFLAWSGVVTMARLASMLALVGLTINTVVLLASLPSSHFIWIRPLLPRSLQFSALSSLALTWVWLIEPVIVGLAVARKMGPDVRARAGGILAAAIGTGALVCAADVWVITANMGPQLAERIAVPFDSLVRGIAYGNIQHLDTIVLPLLVISVASKLGTYFWVWSEFARGVMGGGSRYALGVELVVSAVLAITLLHNAIEADRALRVWAAQRALPAFAVAFALLYIAGAIRKGARQT